MNAPDTPSPGHTTPTPLCPIPRTGLSRPSDILLYVFLILASVMVGLGTCALYVPLPFSVTVVEILAGVTLLLFLVHLWRVSRAMKGLIPLLVLAGVFLIYQTGSLIPTSVLLSLIFAIGEGSMWLAVMTRRQAVWFPLIPLVAAALTAALTQSLPGAVACLVPFPPMLVLAWGTRSSAGREDGLTRVGVICATSLALGVSAVAVAALFLRAQFGSPVLSALPEALEAYRQAYIDEIVNLEFPEGTSESILALTTPENAANMVNSVFNLLPGAAVVVVNLLATVAQLVQHNALRTFGFAASITDRVKVFRISLVSCLVFVAATFVAVLANDGDSTLAGTVAENIYLILLPGLSFAGLLRVTALLSRRGAQGLGCLFYFIILVPCLLFTAPFILPFVEVIGHIFTAIISRIKPPDDDSFNRPPDNR